MDGLTLAPSSTLAPSIFGRMSALADPLRCRALLLLERGELTVSELCTVLQLPQSTVSRHLKTLADDGWVQVRPEGTSRLSPSSLTRIEPGTRLVLPSPNGAALSLLAGSLGHTVVAGCIRNAAAVAEGLTTAGTIAVIAAGERWEDGSLRPAVEDFLGAGTVIAATAAKSWSPEAHVAAASFLAVQPHLAVTLREAMSGRELIEHGFAADVELAAELNASTTFPRMNHGFFSSP
jgi:phosphosulfolactate phosphohydrolase-like enzyme